MEKFYTPFAARVYSFTYNGRMEYAGSITLDDNRNIWLMLDRN